MPRLDVVQQVVAILAAHSIPTALGGSGLLAALGLTGRVRDWDLTTDSDPITVEAALASSGLKYSTTDAGDGDYATRARYRIDGGDHEVDLIVGFALRVNDQVIALPTRVTGTWLGLPLGDPLTWARAYDLMGRHSQAARLQSWLGR